MQIAGELRALPARRGDEPGSYLWIAAGKLHEAVVAELFLPAVAPDQLDGAMGVSVGSVQLEGDIRSGTVRLQFGRVAEGHGVVSASGSILDADIRFELNHHPPDGGYCPHCGAALQVDTVEIITPPDGGLIGAPRTRCTACGRV